MTIKPHTSLMTILSRTLLTVSSPFLTTVTLSTLAEFFTLQISILEDFSQIVMKVYENYFHFLLTMMAMHTLFYVILPYIRSKAVKKEDDCNLDRVKLLLNDKSEVLIKPLIRIRAKQLVENSVRIVVAYSILYCLGWLLTFIYSIIASLVYTTLIEGTIKPSIVNTLQLYDHESKSRADAQKSKDLYPVVNLIRTSAIFPFGYTDYNTANTIILNTDENVLSVCYSTAQCFRFNVSDVNRIRLNRLKNSEEFEELDLPNKTLDDYYVMNRHEEVLFFLQNEVLSLKITSRDRTLHTLTSDDAFKYSTQDTFKITFSSNQKSGYFFNLDSLYYFDTIKLRFDKIKSFICKELKALTLSHDSKLLFAACDGKIHILSITTSNSPVAVSEMTVEYKSVEMKTLSKTNTLLIYTSMETETFLHIIDFINPALPRNLSTTRLYYKRSRNDSLNLMTSPHDLTVYIGYESRLLVIDISDFEKPTVYPMDLSSSFKGLTISSNGSLFVLTSTHINFMTLNVNIEASHQWQRIANFDGERLNIENSNPYHITGSPDGRSLYLVFEYSVQAYDVNKYGSLRNRKDYNLPSTNISLAYSFLSQNYRKLFLIGVTSEVIILDMDSSTFDYVGINCSSAGMMTCYMDGWRPYGLLFYLGDFFTKPRTEEKLVNTAISQLKITALTNARNRGANIDAEIDANIATYIGAYDSDTSYYSQGLSLIVKGDVLFYLQNAKINFVNREPYLFTSLLVFNLLEMEIINDLRDLHLEKFENKDFMEKEIKSIGDFTELNELSGAVTMDLDAENNILYLFRNPRLSRSINIDSNYRQVTLLNISDLMNITVIHTTPEFLFESTEYANFKPTATSFAGDVALITHDNGIRVIDIQDKIAIKPFGLIPTHPFILKQMNKMTYSFTISSHANSIFVNDFNGLRQINARYIIDLPQRDIKIGREYLFDLPVLVRNNAGLYSRINQGLKFLKASLFNMTDTINSQHVKPYRPLLPWMEVDLTSQRLIIRPQSHQKVSDHNIFLAASTQVKADDFEFDKAFLHLMTASYLDKAGYITPNFDPEMDLQLSEYNVSSISKIKEVLRSHYITMLVPFSVVPSLVIMTDLDTLRIETESQFMISTTIVLLSNRCRFIQSVSLELSFTVQPTMLVLHGTKYQVNNALKRVYIDLDRGVNTCSGTITINDGLNPQKVYKDASMSRFFNVNSKPNLNSDVVLQDLVNAKTIYSGSFFSVSLENSLFKEKNLDYSIANNLTVPWLTVDRYYLSGTPPNDIWPPQSFALWKREYHLTLQAKNEFKHSTIDFKLTVYLSYMYVLLLLVKVAGIIGVYVYMPKIYNIIARPRYNHPKSYILIPGQDLMYQNILPIVLLAEEKYVSNILFKMLKKRVATSLNKRSASGRDLARYFWDENLRDIDETLLNAAIESAVLLLRSGKTKRRLRTFLDDPGAKMHLVDQLVINKIAKDRLSLPGEKIAKVMLCSLKKRWLEFARVDDTVPWYISIILSKDTTSLDEAELEKNYALLHRALLAHAFDVLHIDALPSKVNIELVERRPVTCFSLIRRALKLDLKSVNSFNNSSKGCGLQYELTDNVIHIGGTLNRITRGRILALQIANHHGYIIREIWFYSAASKEGQMMEMSSSQHHNEATESSSIRAPLLNKDLEPHYEL